VGAFRVLAFRGSGGLGHVYAVSDVRGKAEPPRAMKLLRPELADRADLRTRFDREALAASPIRHDNVLVVDGPAQDFEGHRFFTMELLVGVDLADAIALTKRLPVARAIRIAIGAAHGLGAAHAHGVIHRDVKPENLFLVQADDGREVVKVLDFSSAAQLGDGGKRRITTRGLPVGTPEYMSPEQIEGAPGHPTADIYSLGVVLYELLAGRVPFAGGSWSEVAHKHATTAPPPLFGISAALDEVIARALAKRMDARFPTMEALAVALAACPEATAKPSSPPRGG
jgi:eukaryotic-like serine/threonine-protein kinase